MHLIQTPLSGSFLKRFVPPYRFIPVQETIIDRSHLIHPGLNENSIKVLSWNIAKNNHRKNWIKDFDNILAEHQPDLIFLQEVRLGTETRHIGALAEMSWNFAPNFIDAYHNSYSGILTAANTRYIARKSLLSKHHEPITKTPKISLVTEYPLSRSTPTILAINTHLINFVNLGKFKTQLHELELAISAHKGPVIFSGDFNTWNRSRGKSLQKMAKRVGLTQVHFHPQEKKKIKRFLLSPPLDYIFYKGLKQKQVSARVIDNISSSDHNPLIVEFSYSEPLDIQANAK